MAYPQYYYGTQLSETQGELRLRGELGGDVFAGGFLADLDALVAAGVTDLTVRIHSVGGSVLEGFVIFSALRACNARVVTVNEGLAASTAGWILLAGDVVQTNDYALFMLHNPSTLAASAKAQEVLSLMRDSIVTILSARSGQSAQAIGEMMDQETWLNAEQCLAAGFVTEILKTEQLVTLDHTAQSVSDMYQIVNSALALNAPAEPETPQAETPATEARSEPETAGETEPQAELTENPAPEPAAEAPAPEVTRGAVADQLAEADTALRELTAQNAALQARLDAFEQKEAEAARLVVVNRAKELVTGAIASGKIAQAAENHWLTLATENHELAASTLAALSVPVRSTTTALNKAAQASGAPAQTGTTLRQLEKKNPREVERLYRENRNEYNTLYFNQYGKFPE